MFFNKNVSIKIIIMGIKVSEIILIFDDESVIRITLISVNIIIRIVIGSIVIIDKDILYFEFKLIIKNIIEVDRIIMIIYRWLVIKNNNINKVSLIIFNISYYINIIWIRWIVYIWNVY